MFVFSLPVAVHSEPGGIVLVVNASVDTSALNRRYIEAVYLGRRRYWGSDKPVKVVMLPQNDKNHIQLCRNFLRVTPKDLSRNWDRNKYTGLGRDYSLASSEAELLEMVSKTPGAAGYVSSSFFSQNKNGGVNVITFE